MELHASKLVVSWSAPRGLTELWYDGAVARMKEFPFRQLTVSSESKIFALR